MKDKEVDGGFFLLVLADPLLSWMPMMEETIALLIAVSISYWLCGHFVLKETPRGVKNFLENQYGVVL